MANALAVGPAGLRRASGAEPSSVLEPGRFGKALPGDFPAQAAANEACVHPPLTVECWALEAWNLAKD